MKQTAVEWLIENSHIIPKNELNKRELIKELFYFFFYFLPVMYVFL